MTDDELEQRLRAWYGAETGDNEPAPTGLREAVVAIPASIPAGRRRFAGRGSMTLLAAAALLVGAGALAGGAAVLRLVTLVSPTLVSPTPSDIALVSPGPSALVLTSPTPTTTPALRTGDLIAFTKPVQRASTCTLNRDSCPVPRVWTVRTDGSDLHELVTDGATAQVVLAWSPDGSRLLYLDDRTIYLSDPDGHERAAVETGCGPTPPATRCQIGWDLAVSMDGTKLAFVRQPTEDASVIGTSIATVDLATGRLAELSSTLSAGTFRPGWSPDGTQIVFLRFGTKDDGGPLPRIRDAVLVVDADGGNLRQISPTTLDAVSASWSPDGGRIVFESPTGGGVQDTGDIYTVRPDGSGLRRLTSGDRTTSPSWTVDGRILFTRVAVSPGGAPGWWTMDADGSHQTLLMSPSAIGLPPDALQGSNPRLQPLGGPAIVAPPWTPAPAVAVGPPAPTPSASPTPDLAAGFTWTGAQTTKDGAADTATLLDDGRVLVTMGCGTGAEVYDPGTNAFAPTGSLGATRSGTTATRLRDGRILITGGYNCGEAGQDGVWASAEIYDPRTGAFTPTGSMHTPREFHTATLLADGRVLIAGGYSAPQPTTANAILANFETADTSASVLASAEIYDPATGTFNKTGSMSTFRDHHTATLLQDGRVLVTGGGGEGYASSTSADVYDPATGTFTKTGSMHTGRWLHTATLLDDGRVLILGGRSPKDSVYRSAEIYDPRTGAFRSAGSMREGRQQHTATLLPDGRVLITGGYWSDGKSWRVLASAEMYDPSAGTFTDIGSIGTPRQGHLATRLPDGRVLIVGGEDTSYQGGVPIASGLLYQP
jgi:dipeptidyl aminopeptidase/acylaminoacyl peptidase